jgi:hypothetical protein
MMRALSQGRVFGPPTPSNAIHRSCLLGRVAKATGIVKPHGLLGPLRSKGFTAIPRAAYRRDGLSRPFRELKAPGKIHLGGSFPLRCIQRLSPPAIATRRCSWRHSRDTSGQFDPVLSY